MQIGMMNNPQKNLLSEIKFAGEHGFDYLDFTLEPPEGQATQEMIPEIKAALAKYNLGIVGHYAWYLPVDSPFESIRKATCGECRQQMEVFAALGVEKLTIHAGFSYPDRFFTYDKKLKNWCKSMDYLLEAANQNGLMLMMENVAGRKDHFRILRDLLKRYPELGFHLDVGHANLEVPSPGVFEYMKRFKSRLVHLHLSDNFGRRDDQHLPIGAGGIPWKRIVKLIKRAKYDESITLEVFSSHREYLLKSREILRSLWAQEEM